jgi:HK97 family phage major capsid protein
MMVREDMIMAIAQAVEIAAIYGTGANSQPLGLLNAGITDISATNGAAPDWASVVNLETKVSTVNALLGSLGYLTNTKVRGVLKQTAKMGNTIAQPIWGEGGNPLNGYQAAVTNNVPSNLTQGTGTGLSALAFGNFRDLLIGQWGGLDITADPYTKAKQGQIVLTVDSFWDVALRRLASFAKTKVVAG